jgi:hypothetical protein
MRPLKDYVDSYGMLGKIWHSKGQLSGGDSAQRMGMWASGLKFLKKYKINVRDVYTDGPQNYEDALCGLFDKKKGWRRHPDEKAWYGDFDRMSRDQIIPNIVALGLFKCWSVLWITFWHHLIYRGLLLMTNTRRNGATKENHGQPKYPTDPLSEKYDYSWKLPDITLFEFWGLYIRALPKWIGVFFYPILLISDLMTLGGGLIRNNNRDMDVLNHCIISVNATANLPTPFIWLANKLTNWDLMAKKLSIYFNEDEAWGDPPLHRIWIPLIMRLK